MKHLIAGYGSLMSEQSRRQFSRIHSEAIAVKVAGWSRAWVTRAYHESQTYVGALPQHDAWLNACLVEVEQIDDDLRARERDFRFVPVDAAQISFYRTTDAQRCSLANDKIWICECLEPVIASACHPVNQSYLDTCMQGCLETGIDTFMHDFVSQTNELHHCWIDDRHAGRYPRAASVSAENQRNIDEALAAQNLLHHRQAL